MCFNVFKLGSFLSQLHGKVLDEDSDELKRQILTAVGHLASHDVESTVDALVRDHDVPFDEAAVRIWRSFCLQPLLASKVLKRLVDKICPMLENGTLEEKQVFFLVRQQQETRRCLITDQL